MSKIIRNFYSITLDDLRTLCYEFALLYGEKRGAKSLKNVQTSLAGNPADIFEIDGKKYTMNFLRFYMRYAYCAKFIDFDSINTVVELGPGSGVQAEVLKKLHPHLRILLFDLPTQLYVCEQYLKNVFKQEAVSYLENRNEISDDFWHGKKASEKWI